MTSPRFLLLLSIALHSPLSTLHSPPSIFLLPTTFNSHLFPTHTLSPYIYINIYIYIHHNVTPIKIQFLISVLFSHSLSHSPLPSLFLFFPIYFLFPSPL
ncbi:hypothetical predicted protein, unknown function [Cryptosporidium parvum]|uniref:Secreted protein n=1 Tax=Cryptosporidium parvum TaxID=5807 RepID=A0A7G2HK41_CRYPV|nr:hypothetical predicted protein, unknown function [Cryptosporidium parvum]